MKHKCYSRLALSLLGLFACNASAQIACAEGPHRDFDYWIGQWQVYTGDQLVGTNNIQIIENGCGLSEQWTSARGGSGVSYNAYDPADKQWHQFWVSAQGYVLRLRGGLDEQGNMVMVGELPNPETGAMDRQRITWSKNSDGSVRQLWEASSDQGHTWKVSFDGEYRKSVASSRASSENSEKGEKGSY